MIKIGDELEGEISMNISGSAYLKNKTPKDIYIRNNNTNRAMHLDTVKIRIIKGDGRSLEGRVISIEKRFKTDFVGVIEVNEKNGYFIPDSPKNNVKFHIPLDFISGALNGQKVLVKMLKWESENRNPLGKVIKVIGDTGKHETEIHSILEDYGLAYKFEDDIMLYAENISKEITQEEIDKRRDMRNVLTFTIDPSDAKDFDDALSIEWVNGECFVGIHIADVSHYVRPDTELDKEVYNRGTSVYLVDRCVPMLPEVLSNNLCSLRPNEDKLCFSAVFKLDNKGVVLEEWFGRTVINSNHRFSYEQAQSIIETKVPDGVSLELDNPFANELVKGILHLNKLAKIMRKVRNTKGSISFDKHEVKFVLDEQNKPIDITFKSSKDSNKLIEEFMLLANKQVAIFVNSKSLPNINRIHDKPNEVKLDALKEFVNGFGYEIRTNSPEEISKSLNKLLLDVIGTPEENMISNLVVRTMQKATYSTVNIGHYGLGFTNYSHFTSPIRRYPDIILHRLLTIYLDKTKERLPKLAKLENRCNHLSIREKLAQKAERDSIKYMQCVYMSNHIGKVFKAVVSSVVEFGVFVEIPENGCDCLVKLSGIDGTWESVDEKHLIREFNTGREIRLGDEVLLTITNVDLERKTIDGKIY